MARLREGSYTLPDGRTVQYSDGEVYKDIADLYAVVPGDFNGTASTESDALKRLLESMQMNRPLDDDAWQIYNKLMSKYRTQLAAFRKGPDNDTQGFVPLPKPGEGRVVESSSVRLSDALLGEIKRTVAS